MAVGGIELSVSVFLVVVVCVCYVDGRVEGSISGGDGGGCGEGSGLGVIFTRILILFFLYSVLDYLSSLRNNIIIRMRIE